MIHRKHSAVLLVLLALTAAAGINGLQAAVAPGNASQQARKLMDDGNFQEALVKFRELTLEVADVPSAELAEDFRRAISCFQQLNQVDQIDDYREAVAEKHKNDWQLIAAVAQSYLDVDHHGFLIAGEFRRGQHRGGGRAVRAEEADFVRAIRLFRHAMDLVETEGGEAKQTPAARGLCDGFAQALLIGRGYQQAWRLQVLTNLDELPDYEDGWYAEGGAPAGAPVDEAGNPVYYDAPESWNKAANDGERWRWVLAQRTAWQPDLKFLELRQRADFLRSQFGVQTLADYGWWFARQNDDADAAKSLFELDSLAENETIARLATGIKRFTLPEEHNFIALQERIASEAGDDSDHGQHALHELATEFENRRQFPRAAELWKRLVAASPGSTNYRQRLEQIVGNWGRFEPVMTQPAGRGATIDYRYRNGQRVQFTARPVKVRELLADVKKYLSSSPPQLDWEQLNIENLGFRLVVDGQDKYLGDVAADWSLDLDPRPNHFDRRITVTTPLQKAGAYLLTAKMADGNEHRVVVWIADTAIVKKPLENKSLYYVADAVTGKAIPKCNVEFFGYWQERLGNRGNRFRVHTKNFAEATYASGLIQVPTDKQDRAYQWLATATTPEGRLAYLGFSGVWTSQYHDQRYQQVKVFTITDRPVYRPEQEVQFKFWVANAKFDQPDASPFAAQSFVIEIHDPRNEKVFTQSLVADAYGGLAGTFKLPAGATLGQYRLTVANHGGGMFRVEEYKKPEFEVKIDAPSEPVKLGDKITATIRANYYFGAPVTEARVKYKVLRTSHDQQWFPPMPWDWLYGPGYWWFAEDYRWYPGWSQWGCARPHPWWFWRPAPQPELVAQQEAVIGPDGTLEIEIDTAAAQQFHPDTDHSYQIQAEVVDQSRRTIVATGRVLAAREPFRVYVWATRGFYRTGDTMDLEMAARTADGKPVRGKGELRLLKITYADGKPVETEVAKWNLPTDDQGRASLQAKASESGQYRLSYKVTSGEHTSEGGQMLVVRGPDFDGGDFRFNNLEIVPDKREYAPGDKAALEINCNRAGAAVLLFLRPSNGVYLPPQFVQLKGKSTVVEVPIEARDMPNFFVEAVTVHGGKMHTAVREIFVPPAKRIFDVEILPSAKAYLPGQQAKIQLKLTGLDGKPIVGSVALAIYDRALDYIAGGSNVADIREFFWKWRRSHQTNGETNLTRGESPVVKPDTPEMQDIGVFGNSVADEEAAAEGVLANGLGGARAVPMAAMTEDRAMLKSAAPGAPADAAAGLDVQAAAAPAAIPADATVQPTIRQNFADTALWVAALETNSDGLAEVELKMPENLTAWRIAAWAMGPGTRVGQDDAEVVTRKNIIVRMQAPRFFVETDEVVLSANVHNYLKNAKQVRVSLELDGEELEGPDQLEQTVEIAADGEARVDWRVKVRREGTAKIRMLALTDEESDAMQMTFPVLVHGMLKTEAYSGAIRPDGDSGQFTFTIPDKRRAEQTRLEVRYSPTLAGAMLDAIPYLIDYPYGCTEQTLNRFLPAVLAQRTLQQMGVDLKTLQEQRTNLNAQEIGDDAKRAAQWRRFDRNPIFNEAELTSIVKAGVNRLTEMQLSDGGWGWFSGWGERSTAHTTAIVVRGLVIAKQNDVALVPAVVEQGVAWLQRYQREQLAALDNWDREANKARVKDNPAKPHADDLDALVYLVLTEARGAAVVPPSSDSDSAADPNSAKTHQRMRDYLYQDRTKLAVYSLATFGLALQYEASGGRKPPENPPNNQGTNVPRSPDDRAAEMLPMILRNLSQYVRQDDENQTAWLDLPAGNWWNWYGSEYEAHAFYLKLLAANDPQGEVAPRLVKYLLNNRKHATYWNSTRDTALVVEAFADYLNATGEAKPNMTVEVLLDGQLKQTVEITPETLITYNNSFVVTGEALAPGEHTIELRKRGEGPLYFNGYVTNFTLEDHITAAGLELKVERRYFKLTPADKTANVAGGRGQVVNQKVEKYDRTPINNLDELASGDLVEVELIVDSKNDYEYIILDDMKAAGFEPVEVRSGYNGNELGAYVEYRDERVALFCRTLARGQHSVSYRLRAEIPGQFSALPTKASAMYAPELKANSDEFKVRIADE